MESGQQHAAIVLRLWEKAADVLGSIRTRMMPLKDMVGGWMDGWWYVGR